MAFTVCKVFEGIIGKTIEEYVLVNGKMSEEQHGFIKGRLCQFNLLTVCEEVSSSLDKEKTVNIKNLNCAKAFTTVPHKCLIQKLQAMGVQGSIIT